MKITQSLLILTKQVSSVQYNNVLWLKFSKEITFIKYIFNTFLCHKYQNIYELIMLLLYF